MTLRRLARIVRHRIASIGRPARLDRDVARELSFHLEALEREGVQAGLSPAEARQAARRALGNAAVLQEECRDQRGVRWWHDGLQDLTYGVRMLRRQPAFAAAAIASLALGIGANAAMLGAIDAVLVRKLPFPEGERLVVIHAARRDQPDQAGGVSLADYRDWSDRQRAFQSLGLAMPWPADIGVGSGGEPAERLLGAVFTPGMFDTLGAPAAIGRTFTEQEGRLGDAARVIVISDGLWRSRFGGDPGVIGRTIRVDQLDRTVIGVMPPAFQYRDARADFWLPLIVGERRGLNPSRLFGMVGRLKTGVSIDDARAEFRALDVQLAGERPDVHAGWAAQLTPLRVAMYGWTLKPLLTLQTAVSVLLVLACVNIAVLLLVRGAVRAPEIRLRLALGASSGRVIRQLLLEGALLSAAGGAGGCLVAWAGLRALGAAMTPPVGAPRVPDLTLDALIPGATVALAISSVLAFGLAPAFSAIRRAGRRSGASLIDARPGRSVAALVTIELALASLLLVGGGLLVRSFALLATRDLGFDPEGLMTFDYRAPGPAARQIGEYEGYQYFDINPAPARTLEHIFDRLRAVSGLDAVAGSTHPLLDSPTTAVVPVGSPLRTEVAYEIVTPGFFTALKPKGFRGRDFGKADRVTTPWVAVVNESAARLLWPGRDAIGQRLTLDIVPEEQSREVIGLVQDLPLQRAQIGARAVVYASLLQQPSRYRAPWATMLSQMNFIVRARGNPLDVLPALRAAVAEVEPTRPIGSATVLGDLSPLMRDRRSYAVTMALFASVATLLAAMGVYGVVARAVTERTREIGIRRALGATSSDVVRLLGRRMTWLALAGVAAGLVVAFALARLLASQLWGITPGDPATYVGTMVLVIATAAAASVIPARRALTVDPSRTLREE